MPEPVRHGYRASHRYDYYAVDDMTENPSGHECSSGIYPFPIIGLTRAMSERIAVALNGAYDNGYKWRGKEDKDREKCEGFANYETSSIALELDNDEDVLERYIRPEVARIRRYHDIFPRTTLAEWLKGFVEMIYTDEITEGNNTLAATLMHAALSRIDWLDLAEHYMSGDK